MPARAFLDRFRPVASPGPAGRPGVPADRVTERDAELRPLLARLAACEQECRRVREDAADRADRLVRTARADADRMVSVTERLVAPVRAAAFAAGQASQRAAVEAERARAHRDADGLRARIAERLPAYAARAAQLALRALPPGDPVHRPSGPERPPVGGS